MKKFLFSLFVWIFGLIEGLFLYNIGFSWRTWQFYVIVVLVAIAIGFVARKIDKQSE